MLKQKIKNILYNQYTYEELSNWFDPLIINFDYKEHIISSEKNHIPEFTNIIVFFPHVFFSKWFKNNGLSAFQKALEALSINIDTVQYKINNNPKAIEQNNSIKPNKVIENNINSNKPKKQVNKNITFNDLIYNNKNFFPINIAQQITKNNSNIEYNPLIFYGNEGTGKTILLSAIATEFSKTIEDNLYIGTVEELYALYQNSKNKLTTRADIKNCKAFLLDDLHLLSEKPDLQKELASLFDIFEKKHCQMVLCSNQKVSDMKWLNEGLFHRICSGICLEIKDPDLEVRIKYIQSRADYLNIPITNGQIISIAHKNPSFSPIKGTLLKIKAYLELYNYKMTEKDFDNIVNNTAITNLDSSSHEAIINMVAKKFNFEPQELIGVKRFQNLVMARQVAMYICRKNLSLSYPNIGRIFGNRDHTTVIHAIKKIDKLIVSNKDMHSLVINMIKMCNTKM